MGETSLRRASATATLLTPTGIHLDEEVVSLDRLTAYMEILRPVLLELDDLRNDLRREHFADCKPVFCLDMSELFELLAIPSDHDPDQPLPLATPASLILYSQIQHRRRSFTLLPGTVFELTAHLRRTLKKAGVDPGKMRGASILSLSTLKGASDTLRTAGVDPHRTLPNLTDLQRLTQLLVQRTRRFQWLLDRIQDGSVTLAHEQTWFFDIHWPSDVFEHVLKYLNRYRPTPQETNNEDDSLNYALCIGASNLYKRTGLIFYLIARGAMIRKAFKSVTWSRDPLATDAMYRPVDLHRDPSYLVLRDHWESRFAADQDQASDSMVSFTTRCRDFLGELSRLRSFGRDEGMPPQRVLHLQDLPAETIDQLTDRANRLNSQYPQVFQSLFLAWESMRRSRPYELPGAPISLADVSGFTGAAITYERTLAEASRLKERLERYARGAKEATEEVRGQRGLALKFLSRKTRRINCSVREITATIGALPQIEKTQAAQEIVLRVDLYDEFFSAWWNVSVDLHTFFDAVDYYARVALRLNEDGSLGTDSPKLQDRGYALVSQGDDGEFELTENYDQNIFPLDLFTRCELLREVALQQAVSIRLFTPFGDFWHNFRQQVSSGPRMGFLSHVCLPNLLGELISVTSQWPLDRPALQQGLHQHLAQFVPKTTIKKGDRRDVQDSQ